MATEERIISCPENPDHDVHRFPDLENRIGIYVLALQLTENQTLTIGKLGLYSFKPGYYQYIGSAGKGIRSRVHRHLERRNVRHWHLDYLLPIVTIVALRVFYEPQFSECECAEFIAVTESGIRYPARFGASDCRCPGHLIQHVSPPVWT